MVVGSPERDKGRVGTTRVVLATLIGLGLGLAACAPATDELTERRTAAAEALAAGRWADAFLAYRDVAELDPGDPVVHEGLAAAARPLARLVPLELELEVDLLRWMVETERWEELASTLDRSVVTIPAGSFVMGDAAGRPDEAPPREVTTSAYGLGRYEVTNAQYARYVSTGGGRAPTYWTDDRPPPGTHDHPVVGVAWPDADGYCVWAGGRLPTEAEWERACRGDDGRTYPWGDTWDPTAANVVATPLPDRDDAWAWLAGDRSGPAGATLEPVGSRPDATSPHGVCDLVGNASEWLLDWYDARAYERLPAEDPLGTEPPWERSVRGSAWLYPHDQPDLVPEVSRCAFRNNAHVADDPRLGFRCAYDG